MRYHWFLLAVLLLGGGRTEGQVTIEKLRQWTFTYGGRYDMPYGLFVSENNIYAYGEPNYSYPYGLYYTTSTEGGVIVGELRGFAWASSDIGWISFGGPILKKVENIDTPDPNNPAKRQVKLIWDNPSNYKEVQIWRKGPGEDYRIIITFDQNNQSQNIEQGKDKNYIDTGLEPNAFYEYFIRGIIL